MAVAETIAVPIAGMRSDLMRQRVRSAWIFLAPMLIVLALVAGWPLVRSIYFSFTDASLYEVLATRYSLYPASARETHQAVTVPEDAAPLLRAPAGAPALMAERLTRLADGRPLEYVHSIMRGDRYRIVLDLARAR